MTTMYILVSDDLSRATIKIEDVSIKHCQIFDDVALELFNTFKTIKPGKIEFGSHNKVTEKLSKMINDYGYLIDPKGNVMPFKNDSIQLINNTISYELKIKNKENYRDLCDLLLNEGHTLSSRLEDGIFVVSIHN